MPITFGVEQGATPIGDRKSLEALARQVNLAEQQKYIAKMKQKNPDWKPKEGELIKI